MTRIQCQNYRQSRYGEWQVSIWNVGNSGNVGYEVRGPL
jgi:hypothetical protein